MGLDKDYCRLMNLLDQVPGVKEHINSFEVKTGTQLLKQRVHLCMTKEQLALLSGTTVSIIDDYEMGITPMDMTMLQQIKSALQLTE